MTISLDVPYKMHNRGRRNSQKQTITGFFGKPLGLCYLLEISRNRRKVWVRIASVYYFAITSPNPVRFGESREVISAESSAKTNADDHKSLFRDFSRDFHHNFAIIPKKVWISVSTHVDTWCYVILGGESGHRRDVVNTKIVKKLADMRWIIAT